MYALLLYMFQSLATSQLTHLQEPCFIDFSNAFNTIQPHILASKIINFNINNTSVSWVMDYLISRPQYVRLESELCY